jgi:hypothetical protein
MEYSISQVLFDWLSRKRLVTTVARRMGMNESTLLSQLRPSTHTAKFAADDLIPLFNAVRDAGYGDELAGILCEYTQRLTGDIKPGNSKADLQNQMVRLMGAIGVISSQLSDKSRHSTERDLVTLLNTLRTEVLPIIVQLENDLGDRLRKARNGESEPGFESGGLALEH